MKNLDQKFWYVWMGLADFGWFWFVSCFITNRALSFKKN